MISRSIEYTGSIILFIATALTLPACADDVAREVLSKAYLSVARIDSLQFVDTVQLLGTTHVLRVLLQGHHYRIEHEFDGNLTVYAYDGRHYQRLETSGNRFSRSRDQFTQEPVGGIYSLLWAYFWLFDGRTPISWQSVKDKAVWDAAMNRATFRERRVEEGEEYQVLSVERTGGAGVVYESEVYFAADIGYLPRKTISRIRNGPEASRIIVDEYAMFDADGERVALPVSVRVTDTGEDGVSLALESDLAVQRGSVRVNDPIDKDLFTLIPTAGVAVFDFDRMSREEEPTLMRAPREEATIIVQRIFFGLLLLIVVVVTAAVWRSTRSGTGTNDGPA